MIFYSNFFHVILLQELDLYDILSFDVELGKVLQELHALVCRKHYMEALGTDNRDAIAGLHFRGTAIEDLCLDFTLPGYPDYILKHGDETVHDINFLNLMLSLLLSPSLTRTYYKLQVDINNLEEYISLVVDATVKIGIMRQMEAFRAGFNQVKYIMHSFK